MELPEHYLPVRICPHTGEGERYRLMFAECGSYENVNLSIDAGKITFLPQKGQGTVKNLRSTQLLPLFDHPLYDEWKQWDRVLHMKSYTETQDDLKYLFTIHSNRGAFKKSKYRSKFAKKFQASNRLLQNCCCRYNSNSAPLPIEQYTELLQSLKGGLNSLYVKYRNVADAYSNKNSSLKGYNKDFYGGLLSSVQKNSAESLDLLIHASGQDIFITEASHDTYRRLRRGRVLDKLALSEPVFQIASSRLCEDEVLIAARQKHRCLLLESKLKDAELVERSHTDISSEVLTSVTFSSYTRDELLISTDSGGVYLWDISSDSRNHLLVKPQDCKGQDKWSCSCFGGHPRHIVVADGTSVHMYDHRSHFTDGMELLTLSPNLTKKEECVTAMTYLGFPYLAVVTDYGVFIIDQRFGTAPVLQWSTEFISCPQYIQVVHQNTSYAEQEKILFVASQQPSEVMCFPVNILEGKAPTTSVIPWKISQIGEFHQNMCTSYACDLTKLERRFEASLAGIAVAQQTSENRITVYQVDGYGDVFYQSFMHKYRGDLYDLKSCTKEERQVADKQAENWLRAFDTATNTRALEVKKSQHQYKSTVLGPDILKDIFSHPPAAVLRKHNSVSLAPQHGTAPHKNLKHFNKLPSNGSSSKLHLALRENQDITETLQQREADHMKKRKKMRRDNLKLKRLQKKKNIRKRRGVRSRRFCESDDSTDEDSGDGVGNKISRETVRSIRGQDGSGQSDTAENSETQISDMDTDSDKNDRAEDAVCEDQSPSLSGEPSSTVNQYSVEQLFARSKSLLANIGKHHSHKDSNGEECSGGDVRETSPIPTDPNIMACSGEFVRETSPIPTDPNNIMACSGEFVRETSPIPTDPNNIMACSGEFVRETSPIPTDPNNIMACSGEFVRETSPIPTDPNNIMACSGEFARETSPIPTDPNNIMACSGEFVRVTSPILTDPDNIMGNSGSPSEVSPSHAKVSLQTASSEEAHGHTYQTSQSSSSLLLDSHGTEKGPQRRNRVDRKKNMRMKGSSVTECVKEIKRKIVDRSVHSLQRQSPHDSGSESSGIDAGNKHHQLPHMAEVSDINDTDINEDCEDRDRCNLISTDLGSLQSQNKQLTSKQQEGMSEMSPSQSEELTSHVELHESVLGTGSLDPHNIQQKQLHLNSSFDFTQSQSLFSSAGEITESPKEYSQSMLSSAGEITESPKEYSQSVLSSAGEITESPREYSQDVEVSRTESSVFSSSDSITSSLLHKSTAETSVKEASFSFSDHVQHMCNSSWETHSSSSEEEDSGLPTSSYKSLWRCDISSDVNHTQTESESSHVYSFDNFECVSVDSKLKDAVLSSPKMRRLVSPSLAGFLLSPRSCTRERKKKLFLQK